MEQHIRRANSGKIPPEVKRQNSRKNRLELLCLLMTIAVIFGIYNVIYAATERFSLRADLTESQIFHLTDPTLDILSALEQDVVLTYCNSKNNADSNLREILDRYAAAGSRLELRYMDLESNPAFAEEYAAKNISLSPDGILVSSAGRDRFIQWSDCYTFHVPSGSQSYSITGLKAETMLTSAIVAVTSEDSPAVVFTAGHSENTPELLKELIQNSNYETSQVVLGVEPLPSGISTIIIAGARRDFSAAELAILEDHMSSGGNLCVFRDPKIGSLPNLDSYLAEWGIRVTDQVVLEPSRQMDSPLNIIPNFGLSMISVWFSEHSAYLVMPECRALELSNTNACVTNAVLRSSSSSYGKVYSEMATLSQEKSDASGPFTVAATSERSYTTSGGETATQYVFATACTGFYEESWLKTESLGNSQLILQALSYMNGSDISLNIPAKSLQPGSISISRTAVVLFALVFAAALPLALITVGLCVFLKRRHS